MLENRKHSINCRGQLLSFEKPVVMGILNVTPDSFYDGGHYLSETAIVKRCETMLADGASIIDIGAVSTRPGLAQASYNEEKQRLTAALRPIRKHFPKACISLDTYRADIVEEIHEDFGIDIVNDISAGTLDKRMFETVARLQLPYILMHIQGNPETMQQNPHYDNLMSEILDFLSEKLARLREIGVHDIIIDPGFGFGKTEAHNYELLRELRQLEILDCPILAAASRKSMIYRLLETDAQHALNGTTAVNTIALLNGASLLRVHDVREAVECIKIVEKLNINVKHNKF